MARQINIPGTERNADPELEEIANDYRDARDKRMVEAKELHAKEKLAKLKLIAAMQSRDILLYRFDDNDGEELEIKLDEEVDVTVRKTGEMDTAIGEGVMADADPDVMPAGLLAQAEAAMADSGIEISADGDVVVPDTAAPKRKRGRPRKNPEPS